MRKRTLLLCVCAVGLAWLAVSANVEAPVAPGADPAPASARPTGEPITNLPESTGECADDASFALDATSTPAADARGCKKCRGRDWCECSYQGKPRISCDPCCYQGPFDPLPVCLD